MEHLVVIPDSFIQEIAACLVQGTGVFTVFLIQKIRVRLGLIGSVAVNGGDPELLRRICGHLLLEFLIIEPCHRDGCNAENGIESTDSLLLFHLFNRAVGFRGDIRDIHQGIEEIGLVAAIGLLVEVLQYILRDKLDPFRSHEGLLTVDIPDILIIDIRVCIHGFDIVHTKGQNVLVIDGIHNCIGVELVSEGLLRREELRIPDRASIGREDRRTGKSEEMILLEALDDGRMHVSELAAMAFVKDDDYMLLVDIMARIFLDESGELLDCCNNDMGVRILQLAFSKRSYSFMVW